MDTETLWCALCVHELGTEASTFQIDGGQSRRAPGPNGLRKWLDWVESSGAPVTVNGHELCTLNAVTLVYGTATCAGHIMVLINKHPRAFG